MPIRLFASLLVTVLLAVPVAQATGVTEVQFRDLFFRGGNPSPKADRMSGGTIELTGFIAMAPTEESPFLVLTGAPTEKCPYCNASDDDHDHLPYVLVYPEGAFQHSQFSPRTRVRVRGILSAEHSYEDFYGLHNDVRILGAQVVKDQGAMNPVITRLRAKRAAEKAARAAVDGTAPVPAANVIDPRSVDE